MFQETKEKEAAELGMKNVGGVFLVLAAGLSIACIIACVERYWVSRRKKIAIKLVRVQNKDFENSILFATSSAKSSTKRHIGTWDFDLTNLLLILYLIFHILHFHVFPSA